MTPVVNLLKLMEYSEIIVIHKTIITQLPKSNYIGYENIDMNDLQLLSNALYGCFLLFY